MPFTYLPSTDAGKVRLLIPDADPAKYVFDDEEIDTFLVIEGGRIKRAAALALETMASNEAFTQKVIKLLDLSTDGAKVADALLKRAAELRRQAKADEEAEEAADGFGGFAIAEWWLGNASLRDYLARGAGVGWWDA